MDRKLVRRKQRLFRYSVDVFIELLNQVSKKNKKYSCNDSDVKGFDKFLTHFGMNVGEEFIRKFAEYGFQSWFNSTSPEDYSDKIRYNWVFGDAAINRWNKFSADKNVEITRNHLKRRSDFKVGVKVKVNTNSHIYRMVNSLIEREETQKARFLNTKKGLSWCIVNTTLYFHKSTVCISCIYKNDCKSILKENYSNVYKMRGYDE